MSQFPMPLPPSPAQPALQLYARLAWRWLWLVLLCALAGGAAACFASLSMTPIYQAASKVMINEARTPAAASYTDILASERLARTYADLMTRRSVVHATFLRLGLDPALAETQIASLAVSPVRDTQLVALTVEGPDPQLITAVANALPPVFVDELRTIQSSRFAESKASLARQLDEIGRQVETTRQKLADLEPQRTPAEELEYTWLASALAQYQAIYANLLQSDENLRLAEAQSTDTVVLIEAAAAPDAPVRPRVLVNTLLAAVMGALAALGTLFLLEYLDDRVQTPEDLQRIADVPVLGAIGTASHAAGPDAPITMTDPHHPLVEAYRRLRTNLQFYNLDAGLTSLLVTSAEPGEGKSMTAANLAVVLAQAGTRVILVDADLRQPHQHLLFDLPRRPGLAQALRSGLSAKCLPAVPGIPTLRLLAGGETVPNPAEVLGSQRMHRLVAQLRDEADFLIFDTPPLLAVTDAQVVGRLVDGALLVIDSRKTAAAAVHRGLQALAQVHVPVMGAVLNRLPGSGRGYYASYYYASRACVSGGTPHAVRPGLPDPPTPTRAPLPAHD